MTLEAKVSYLRCLTFAAGARYDNYESSMSTRVAQGIMHMRRAYAVRAARMSGPRPGRGVW
jgi:hypothetical protein